mmetsp:Transcript_24380/g.48545  ORF Transcript_24380/g.48545 Transcript_24380/m.48545 type:complete len:111 (+) Transcript_24380:193-525(+)
MNSNKNICFFIFLVLIGTICLIRLASEHPRLPPIFNPANAITNCRIYSSCTELTSSKDQIDVYLSPTEMSADRIQKALDSVHTSTSGEPNLAPCPECDVGSIHAKNDLAY